MGLAYLHEKIGISMSEYSELPSWLREFLFQLFAEQDERLSKATEG
jgi:hypothetical protein